MNAIDLSNVPGWENCPTSLEVCPACSDRIAKKTTNPEPSDAFKRNSAPFVLMVSSGEYIEDIDAFSQSCDLCEAHHYNFDGFRDATGFKVF